jgi:hypothetical protein
MYWSAFNSLCTRCCILDGIWWWILCLRWYGKQLSSLVEDYVFTTGGDNLGINYNAADIVYGSHNSLYNEIVWFYPTAGESQINRSVVYNFV